MTTPSPHVEQALALQAEGRWDEAEASYRRCLAHEPHHVAALSNLGLILNQQGKREEAIAFFERALAIEPNDAALWATLAQALQDAGRWSEAEAAYRKALRQGPGSAALYSNLGVVLHALGQTDDAAIALGQALDRDPDHATALGNLAKVLQSLGRLAESERLYRRAIAVQPGSSDLHSDLGAVILGQGRWEEAVALLRRAIALDASNGLAHVNLGKAFLTVNKLGEALGAFETCLSVLPDLAEAHFGVAETCLLRGDYRRGWAHYEWRWHTKGYRSHFYHTLSLPVWRAEPVDGLSILVHSEQGIGDTIQFVRFAPELARRGATVTLEAPGSLRRLLASVDGISLLPLQGPSPPFHARTALMSLPHLLETTVSTIPAPVSYLRVAAPDVERWRTVLGAGGFKIGLVWAGNPMHRNDANRSMSLAALAPLFDIPGARWFSLQKMPPAADRAALARFGDRLAGLALDDFHDTAGAVSALDLVVSVDTSVCHLAGALGRPVWIMLPFAPDWRWLLDRDDSPWYPTARLFRQAAPGAWPAVIQRIGEELEPLIRASQAMA